MLLRRFSSAEFSLIDLLRARNAISLGRLPRLKDSEALTKSKHTISITEKTLMRGADRKLKLLERDGGQE